MVPNYSSRSSDEPGAVGAVWYFKAQCATLGVLAVSHGATVHREMKARYCSFIRKFKEPTCCPVLGNKLQYS